MMALITSFICFRFQAKVVELKILGLINALSKETLKVATDFEHMTEFAPHVTKCRIVARESAKVYYIYQYLSTPIVADRDYTIRIEESFDVGTGAILIKWNTANHKGHAPIKGVVRVPVADGGWIFAPVDRGKHTLATYYLYTDPGGAIPAWLTNIVS